MATQLERQPGQGEFIQWLEKRIQSAGYTVDSAPSYLRDAYLSGNPKDLNQLVWQEWWEYKHPEGRHGKGPSFKVGPRGGFYTDDVTKDGRPYRRYF